MTQIKFSLGQIVATPAALETLTGSGMSARQLLTRHLQGDWGVVSVEDAAANLTALGDGARLLSAYRIRDGQRIWIITEAEDDFGRRPATTILLPEEY